MNIDSPFEQWRLKYMKGTAASREIMELLALAFEGGRVAEREACAKLCEARGNLHGGLFGSWAQDIAERIRAKGEK